MPPIESKSVRFYLRYKKRPRPWTGAVSLARGLDLTTHRDPYKCRTHARFLGRLLREQRDHHNGDAGEHECRQELIYAEPAAEGFTRLCHAKTDAAPTSIPAIPPCSVVRFQYRENSTRGPNDAPNPAHAYDTTWKIDEFSSSAITIPKIKMTTSVNRATIMTCASVASFFISPR